MYKIFTFIISILSCFISIAQPINDNCNNAIEIIIPNSGYATGIFVSDTIDISSATMQSGETVPPAILVAGQNQKSVWFKFKIATNRQLRATLKQPGTTITAGDVGFSIYKTQNCLPNNSQISLKLTPIETFGNSYHPCVDSGDYLIQVSSKMTANGPIFIELDIDPTYAPYDERDSAYQFGIMNQARKHVIYEIGCHSKESIDEVCSGLPNPNLYTKTSWHTFQTPAYFDYIAILLATGSGSYFTTNTNHTIGYRLYEGDARTTSLNSLIPLDTCDTLVTTGYYPARRTYKCGALDPNKTYSIQLIFRHDFNAAIRLGIFKEGIDSAKGPLPIASQIHNDNKLGVLPFGTTNRTDYFACNALHINNACGNTKTTNGIVRGGYRYNISTYFTFEVDEVCNIQVNANNPSGVTNCRDRYIRVFSDSVTNNCNDLDTTALYDEFFNSKWLNCIPPGKYTIQVMGTDSQQVILYYSSLTTTTSSACMFSNFGQPFTLSLVKNTVHAENNFSLFQNGAFDTIYNYQPLNIGTNHLAKYDTFGCMNAVLPANNSCDTNYKKAMYRQFVVADSGILDVPNRSSYFYELNAYHYYKYQLYRGNANTLAQAQNVWSYPDTISGLIPYSTCFQYNNAFNVCVVPDTYSLVTLGTDIFVGKTDRPSVRLRTYSTEFHSPNVAQNMGDLVSIINNVNGGYVNSITDTFSCYNNADTINGTPPCGNAKKAIYREFYLSQNAFTTITRYGYGTLSLFKGRASTGGLNSLDLEWQCFTNRSTLACEPLDTGWYTIVSYGTGSSYDNPFPNGDISGGDAGGYNWVRVTLTYECAKPKYNRPHKAAVDPISNNPILVEWNAAADTGAYPVTARSITLPTENFDCSVDTPFTTHPINACHTSNNRVAYYTFELTQESYLVFYPGNHWAKIYKADVRTDSAQFDNTILPLQACMQNSSRIEICKAQPGIYTLVLFAGISNVCNSIAPVIYIDKVGVSRFDHANNAYDFDTIPPNNAYINGKLGDVNPLHSGRAPSNDFFYCTTGAQNTDPTNSSCHADYNPLVYQSPDTNNVLYPAHTTSYFITRRNLWYTFKINHPGWVSVKVDNKTPGRMSQVRYAVYRSDVDGNLNFSQVVTNGLVDSSLAQGLTHIIHNGHPYTVYCEGYNEISFFVEPCNFNQSQRYYVVVDNRNPSYYGYNPGNNDMRPNHQVEVSVKLDSIIPPMTQFDYYATAGDMDTIDLGTHFGPEDNYACATRNASYPSNAIPSCGQKTLWYKFTVADGVTGKFKARIWLDSIAQTAYNANNMRLYRELTPGDSTINGLQHISLSYIYESSSYWMLSCISQGTYYLVLTGCDRIDEMVFPEIRLTEDAGDYCSAPIVANISGNGTASASLLVDCHTIGSDYGEFSDTLTCPPNGIKNDYKTSWFRIDITGTDTVDVTTYLTENTNATSAQIQYRMMTGNCNAMQEQSCVLDAQTQNTYQCMIPGNSYFIQVFVPKYYFNNSPSYPTTGTITLNLSSVIHGDTCSPLNNCLANANFVGSFNCNTNDSAVFVNYSTYGNSIQYLWDFGYNNETSTQVAPKFRYPALANSASYTVTLRVINTDCNDTAYATQQITIPPRPGVNLGPDTVICTYGDSLLLDATSHNGSTYLWHNNSTNPTFLANLTGSNWYKVSVTYAGCTVKDSINVYITPLFANPKDTFTVCSNEDTITLNAYRNFSGTTYLWNNNSSDSILEVSSPGVYWADITLNGCTVRDSFIVLNNNDTFNVLGNDTSICVGASGFILNAYHSNATSYLWQNNSTNATFNVDTSGTYWVEVVINGCTFSDTINVTSAPFAQHSHYDTLCFKDYYVLPGGDTAYTSGVYVDTLLVTNSCDSIVSTYLYFRDSVGVIVYDTVCSNQLPLVWNGLNVNSGGANAASYTTNNIYGCDSTTILHLTINLKDSISFADSTCISSLPYNFLGTPINSNGTYHDTLQNVNGCDSIVTLIFTILPEYTDTIQQQICQGDTFVYNSFSYTTSGNYTHYFNSSRGCDSIVTLALTVNPYLTRQTFDTICFEDYYVLPGGDTAYTSGIYTDTLTIANTCDSIITTNLYFRDSVGVFVYDTICNNQLPYIWNGINVNSSGAYAASYTTNNIYGCDSTSVLNLTINVTDSTWHTDSLCLNDLPYNFLGTQIYNSGTYHDTLFNIHGCDSIVTLIFNVLPIYSDTISAQICQGDSFAFNSTHYNTTGFYTNIYTAQNGCDSFKTLNLVVHPIPNAPIVNSPINYCLGATAQPLSANGNNLLWYTNSSGGLGNAIAPTPSTAILGKQVYYVSQTINNCEGVRDSIEVYILEQPIADFIVIPDTAICSGDTISVVFTGYAPDSANVNWMWGDGITQQISDDTFRVSWNTQGTKSISLEIENRGCFDGPKHKTIDVFQGPGIPTITLPDYVCINEKATIIGISGFGGVDYHWQYNGNAIDRGNEFDMTWNTPGVNHFSLYVTYKHCTSATAYDSIRVIDLPSATILLEEQIVCKQDTISLHPKIYDVNASYLWTPEIYFPDEFLFPMDQANTKAFIHIPGWISLEVTNAYGCKNKDSVFIDTKPCCDLNIPNAFSPNADGLNDIFRLHTIAQQSINEFAIYNRFGERVFISYKQEEGWDGMHKGKPADAGVYHYYLKYTCSDGSVYIKKGQVHLIR